MSETEETIRGSGHQCACVHFDRYVCANMRYQRIVRFPGVDEFDPCDCGCHDDYDDEQDEEAMGMWE
jgi:hypothetical protein